MSIIEVNTYWLVKGEVVANCMMASLELQQLAPAGFKGKAPERHAGTKFLLKGQPTYQRSPNDPAVIKKIDPEKGCFCIALLHHTIHISLQQTLSCLFCSRLLHLIVLGFLNNPECLSDYWKPCYSGDSLGKSLKSLTSGRHGVTSSPSSPKRVLEISL